MQPLSTNSGPKRQLVVQARASSEAVVSFVPTAPANFFDNDLEENMPVSEVVRDVFFLLAFSLLFIFIVFKLEAGLNYQ
ncbi:hypothetical protein L5515_016278 [Caenorhabditis briggsae]|uniref:Uncharacterized protein n=1 Tax=Caenorhabditis briggsae TaxID=6238 RepID=A0AAE9F664_CAEBR|nr:hypothetical protein L5515_016278 [Caenorhabditis briggsae]